MRTVATLVLAAAALIGPPATTASAGGWGQEEKIPLPRNAGSGELVMNEAGDAAIAVPIETTSDGGHGAMVTVRPPGGAFAPPLAIDEQFGPQTLLSLGMAADGTLLVVSQFPENGTGLVLREAPRGGPLSPPLKISDDGRSDFPLQVGEGADGATIVAWAGDNGAGDGENRRLHWRIRTPGGAFGPILSNARGLRQPPVLGIDGAGNAALAWIEDAGPMPREGQPDVVLRVMRRPAGGAFGSAETLAASGPVGLGGVQVAVSGGRVALSWAEDPTPGGTTPRGEVIRASAGTIAGGLSAPQTLMQAVDVMVNGAIALDAAGEGVATWTAVPPERPDGPRGPSKGYARLLREGSWLPTAPLPGDSYNTMDAAVAPDGTAIVTWATENADAAAAVVAPPGGGFGAPTPFSAGGKVHVAFDGAGRGLAAWASWDWPLHVRPYTAGAPATTPTPVTTPTPETPPAPGPPVAPSSPIASTAPPARVTAAASSRPAPRCRVPKLTGLSRTRAATALRRAGCRLGTVTTPRALRRRSGLVVRRQSRRPGTRVAAGTRIAITLGTASDPHARR